MAYGYEHQDLIRRIRAEFESPSGFTALHDALIAAAAAASAASASSWNHRGNCTRGLVLITDGHDTVSSASEDDALAALGQLDVAMNATQTTRPLIASILWVRRAAESRRGEHLLVVQRVARQLHAAITWADPGSGANVADFFDRVGDELGLQPPPLQESG